MKKRKVLIVEDDCIVAMDTQLRLEALGYIVSGIASSGGTAISAAKEGKPDVVLMDISLKGEMNGIEAAKVISSRFGIPSIFVTGYSDADFVQEVEILGQRPQCLGKPFRDHELRSVIDLTISSHHSSTK